MRALFDKKASLRYMVVPSKREAIFPLKNILNKAVQLNQQQPFRFERSQLIEWLDEAISKQSGLQHKETQHTKKP